MFGVSSRKSDTPADQIRLSRKTAEFLQQPDYLRKNTAQESGIKSINW
jgi:hypothetical protein